MPALGCGCYHITSYRLVMQCCAERHTITHGSVSSHRDYSKRMGLLLIDEIQSGYFQNNSVSVEGALLEWVDVNGERHMHYF